MHAHTEYNVKHIALYNVSEPKPISQGSGQTDLTFLLHLELINVARVTD